MQVAESQQGQIADRSKVNGQKSVWSTVKPPKTAVKALTRGRSCDYSVYGSDPPLKQCCTKHVPHAHSIYESRALYGITQRLNALQLSKYGSHCYYRFVFQWHSRVLAELHAPSPPSAAHVLLYIYIYIHSSSAQGQGCMH